MIVVSTDTIVDCKGTKRDYQCHRYLSLWQGHFFACSAKKKHRDRIHISNSLLLYPKLAWCIERVKEDRKRRDVSRLTVSYLCSQAKSFIEWGMSAGGGPGLDATPAAGVGAAPGAGTAYEWWNATDPWLSVSSSDKRNGLLQRTALNSNRWKYCVPNGQGSRCSFP